MKVVKLINWERNVSKIYPLIAVLFVWVFAPFAHAEHHVDNKIIGVQILPLPNDSVRLTFQFDKPLTRKPANFTIKDPAKLIFDFPKFGQNMPTDGLNKKINVGDEMDALENRRQCAKLKYTAIPPWFSCASE